MDRDIDWALLTRYLTGHCTPQEEQDFARWLAADEARAAFVATMRKAWHHSGAVTPPVDVDAAYRKTAARLGLEDIDATRPGAVPRDKSADARPDEPRVVPLRPRQVAGSPSPHATRRSRRAPWLAAAAVAALALAGGFWRVSTAPEPEPNFVDTASTHVTQPGQRLERRLPDGTRVLLSAASALRVPNDYGRRSRRVYLEGEGFFEVVRDTKRPFVVHTAHGLAAALGTQFGVRSYAGDTLVSVVVAEGVVSLKPDEGSIRATPDSVVLHTRDLGRAASGGRLTTEHDVAVDAELDWTEGRLVLVDTPLDEAIRRLNRWYDLDIRLADSVAARLHVTGTFTTEPLSQILQFLTAPLGLEYERRGRTILIRKPSAEE